MPEAGSVQTGGCQCGAVRYEVTGPPIKLYVCHCTECQRQSGSAFGMSFICAESQFPADPRHARTV